MSLVFRICQSHHHCLGSTPGQESSCKSSNSSVRVDLVRELEVCLFTSSTDHSVKCGLVVGEAPLHLPGTAWSTSCMAALSFPQPMHVHRSCVCADFHANVFD